MCISDKGDVYSCGFSYCGAHGFPGLQLVIPDQITSLKNVISISCGKNHTTCLDTNGSVFILGSNLKGQLGIGSTELKQTEVPQKVNLPSTIQISCGNYFTICLTDNGDVYSFGDNLKGQLGIGNNVAFFNTPQLIESLKDVEFVECGGEYVFCKTIDNQVFCWGNNEYGQLGLGNTENQNLPIQCSSLLNINTVDIKCGDRHTLLLTMNQQILSCGYNEEGQLGRSSKMKYSYNFKIINELSAIIRIECGDSHSMCVDENRDIYFFGDNGCGQFGVDDETSSIPLKHPSLANIIDISKGGEHTFVKVLSELNEEEVYSFGYNQSCQLGSKEITVFSLSPTKLNYPFEDIWVSSTRDSKCKSARSIR